MFKELGGVTEKTINDANALDIKFKDDIVNRVIPEMEK